MRHIHRHRLAIVQLKQHKNKRGKITSVTVNCFDCVPNRVGNVPTMEAAKELRTLHRAEKHPNGVESHRAVELFVEYKGSWK